MIFCFIRLTNYQVLSLNCIEYPNYFFLIFVITHVPGGDDFVRGKVKNVECTKWSCKLYLKGKVQLIYSPRPTLIVPLPSKIMVAYTLFRDGTQNLAGWITGSRKLVSLNMAKGQLNVSNVRTPPWCRRADGSHPPGTAARTDQIRTRRPRCCS